MRQRGRDEESTAALYGCKYIQHTQWVILYFKACRKV
jgi:hypothetical protein